jgi:hypothetical protein
LKTLTTRVCLGLLLSFAVTRLYAGGTDDVDSTRADEDLVGLDHQPQQVTSSIKPLRLVGVGSATALTFYSVDRAFRNNWWYSQRIPFHFREDNVYALDLDKYAHVYAAAAVSFVFARSLEWSGFSRTSSVWYGAGLGLLFQTYIEFQDGFSPEWGFSRWDAIGNCAGAAFFVLQHNIPFVQSFDLKISYKPSAMLGKNGSHGIAVKQQTVIDDYEGQTYWLGIKVRNFLPVDIKPYWPSFLGIAAGITVRDLLQQNRRREFYISLDYDFTALPGDSWFLKTLKEAANYIHFPAPAVRISQSAIWYGLYF